MRTKTRSTKRPLLRTLAPAALGALLFAGASTAASAAATPGPEAPDGPGDYGVSMQLRIYNVEDYRVEVTSNYPANHCSDDWTQFTKALDDNNIFELGYRAKTSGSCAIQDSKGHWFVQLYDAGNREHGRYEVWLDEGRMGLYRAGASTLSGAADITVDVKADPAHGTNWVSLTRS
jgi:hypothetical protein